MNQLETIVAWLADNESAISAVAAILVICGMVYAVLRIVAAQVIPRRIRSAMRQLEENTPAQEPPAERRDATPLVKPITPIHEDHASLAVLLFEVLSSNEDDTFIASGIASEVIALVTPVPDIRVSSRNTTFGWTSGETDLATVGREVNADFALTGSLQRSGERIRVIARLTDVHSGAEVWTHSYDRQLEDLFEVQHDIAKSIVGAILGEVKRAEVLLANRMPNHQLDSWGLVQKAYHFWLTNFSVERMLQACDYLRQAIEIDPEYANARAALAMLLAQQMTSRVCTDYEAVAREASEMIEAAYRQAPNDVDVLENAGVTWQNLGEGKRAVMAFRHALEIAPLNLITRGYLAMTLAFTQGREGAIEAQRLLEENLAIAPKHPVKPYWHYFQAIAEQCLGNNRQAIELGEKSLLGQPAWVHTYYIMANAHCVEGDIDAARADLASAAAINPFLTPALYLENVERITGDSTLSQPFIGGLVDAGLAT